MKQSNCKIFGEKNLTPKIFFLIVVIVITHRRGYSDNLKAK